MENIFSTGDKFYTCSIHNYTSLNAPCPDCELRLQNERNRYEKGFIKIFPTLDGDLALKLSIYVHDTCKEVPHDIGLKLVEIIKEHLGE